MSNETTILHRAAWLVPVSSPPVPDGAVLVRGEQILSAGPFADVTAQAPASAQTVDHGDAALIPGLVNAHTHLELTGLSGLIPLPQPGFSAWLPKVFEHRPVFSLDSMRQSVRDGADRIGSHGTVLCGDINNGSCLGRDSIPAWPHRHVFFEVLGFDRQGLTDAVGSEMLDYFAALARTSPEASLAAHATYSTAPQVIREAKGWCQRTGRVFSMHVAEHMEEVEFLRSGTGFCRGLLQHLGRWVNRWNPPGVSPLSYVDSLGVLDRHTLVVHAVHLDADDWDIARKRSVSFCFCPRSNHNLGAGRADIPKALELGLVTALGTDSLASNSDLDLFAEAAFTLEQYPTLSPEAVLTMITLGGATALGHARTFGSIEPGKSSRMLSVNLPASVSRADLAASILCQGREGAWKWLSPSVSV